MIRTLLCSVLMLSCALPAWAQGARGFAPRADARGLYIQLNPIMVPLPSVRTQKFQIITIRLFPHEQKKPDRACNAIPRAAEEMMFHLNETPMLPTDFIDFGLEDLQTELLSMANERAAEDLYREVEIVLGTAAPAEHSRALSKRCR